MEAYFLISNINYLDFYLQERSYSEYGRTYVEQKIFDYAGETLYYNQTVEAKSALS